MILWLYTFEPPFYQAVNELCRTKNPALLPLLGPFAYALSFILELAERYRPDKLKEGSDNIKNHYLGTMSETFFTYRGVYMEEKWLLKWINMT
jgi:hypothetical protein